MSNGQNLLNYSINWITVKFYWHPFHEKQQDMKNTQKEYSKIGLDLSFLFIRNNLTFLENVLKIKFVFSNNLISIKFWINLFCLEAIYEVAVNEVMVTAP